MSLEPRVRSQPVIRSPHRQWAGRFFSLPLWERGPVCHVPIERARRGCRGFTLLEILVASAVASLLFAALYGVFSRTLASKHLAEERSRLVRVARIALLRMGDELHASFPLETDNAHFVGETRRGGTFPEATLSFVSFASSPVSKTGLGSTPSAIGYALIPDPTIPTLYTLARWENRNPVDTQTATHSDLLSQAYPLLSNVRGLRIRFFDGRRWREGWGKNETHPRLPRGVEVTLYLENSQEEVIPFSTLIDLPLADFQGSTGSG